MDKHTAINKICSALKRRSGKTWQILPDGNNRLVIIANPLRLQSCGLLRVEDQVDLSRLLSLPATADPHGVSFPKTPEGFREYVKRAEGKGF